MTQSLPSPWLCLPAHLSPPLLSDTFSCLCHPPHFLAPSVLSLSEFLFESLSLKGRLQLLQTSPEACHLFFSFCCSFLFLSVLVFIRSAVPPNAAVAEQTYTHKTHCSPTKQMAGWECQVLCYFIPTNTISGDAAPTREPQGAPGLSQKCRQSYKANCSVVSLCPSFLHYRQFIWTSWKPEWLCVLYVCLCVHGCIYCICVCLICSACLIMLTRDDGLEE